MRSINWRLNLKPVRTLKDKILEGFDDEVSIDLYNVYSKYDLILGVSYDLREFCKDQLEETEE